MKISDGRGRAQIELAKKNKKAVFNYFFVSNPDSTITECCKSLGLSYRTVRKHINTLLKEGK